MYKINVKDKTITEIEETNLDLINLQERTDLQQWIRKNPEILSKHFETDFKIISEEFDEFEVNDRLDLLAIDESGALVIIELKKKSSGSRIDIQGLKYASYCSTLSPTRVVEIYQAYLEKNGIDLDPKEDILEFIGLDKTDESDLLKLNYSQKIVLVSQNFDLRVKSVVAYLSKLDVDISCIEFRILKDKSTSTLFIDTIKILPPEDIEQYFIKGTEKRMPGKATGNKLIPQSPDIFNFLETFKKVMEEKFDLHARGMPHVKYRTFKAGKSSLEFAFEIMKKDKRYKINLIAKKPQLELVTIFESLKTNLPLKEFSIEIIRAEDVDSEWERILTFIDSKNFLNDAIEMADLMKKFMDALEPVCKKIREG